MIPFLMSQVLSENEIRLIHDSMIRILSRTGVRIEHPKIRAALADSGADTDDSSQMAQFPEKVIEKFLADTRKTEHADLRPSLSSDAGVYQGKYLEPGTNRIIPFTEKTVKDYIKLARLLPNVSEIHLLNYPPLAGSPTELLELRAFAWKNGAGDDGSIHRTELCPYLYDMYCIKAEYTGKSLQDEFRGIVFFISPLKFSRCEAEQFYFFYEKGLRVGITNMITLGGSGPVTLAGSVALNLAENIAIGVINRALFHDDSWTLSSMIAPLDMRTLIQPYGRPEMLLTNLAAIQLARHYQVPFWVHTGLSDAKIPSPEAGIQKILTALPCALAGWGRIEPGLLSIDEIYSPIQMIIDNEMAGAVRRILKGFDVNDETLATQLIEQKGPGGLFTDTEHTVKYFRGEIWEPSIWSREMLNGWLHGDRKTDLDKALDLWKDLMNKPDFPPELSEEAEQKLREVIKKAQRDLK
jgi:trimethylamine--corrinoid protein Co-methyltransferase